MPKTIPAAGEAMPETLEDLIARHNAAVAAANACNGPLENTPEEAELHAAHEAFIDSPAKLHSYTGVLDALRIAAKENEDFVGSEINNVAVRGALDFLEERENETLWVKAKRLGKELSAVLEELGDPEFAFIRPASNEFAVCFGALPHNGVDPLLTTLNNYQESSKLYEAMPIDKSESDEEAIERTYGPHLEALRSWDSPARSRETVAACLELVLAEKLATESYAPALIKACLSFVRGEMI